ncbi:hypothetical protein FRX31_007665, partial [Thalictrum thalictroides]
MGTTSVGSAFRLVEENGSITGTVRSNRRGCYLQVISHCRSKPREFLSLCFPEGYNGNGWGLVGSKLRSMLDRRAENQAPVVLPPANRFEFGSSPSFVQICREKEKWGGERFGNQHMDLFLTGDSSTVENWSLMVTCKASGQYPDWKWCEEKVKGVFNYTTFSITKKNEALISFKSQEE